jgi:hypothetical protein
MQSGARRGRVSKIVAPKHDVADILSHVLPLGAKNGSVERIELQD